MSGRCTRCAAPNVCVNSYFPELAPKQCAVIALDYKLNFTPEASDRIPQLHERVSERMYNLLTSNGGLYIKLGTFHLIIAFCDALQAAGTERRDESVCVARAMLEP